MEVLEWGDFSGMGAHSMLSILRPWQLSLPPALIWDFLFVWDLPPISAAFLPHLENIKEKTLFFHTSWLVRVALCSCWVDPVLPDSEPSPCLSFPTPRISRLLCRAEAHNGPFIPAP